MAMNHVLAWLVVAPLLEYRAHGFIRLNPILYVKARDRSPSISGTSICVNKKGSSRRGDTNKPSTNEKRKKRHSIEKIVVTSTLKHNKMIEKIDSMDDVSSAPSSLKNQKQQQQEEDKQEELHSTISTEVNAEVDLTERIVEDRVEDSEDLSGEKASPIDEASTSALLTLQTLPGVAVPISIEDYPARLFPKSGFNVVLTHCTADFDSLASAVGLAKLWSIEQSTKVGESYDNDKPFDAPSHVPTFVILPRGAHPGVQRFLGLHKHLFPIRSLKSLLQSDCVSSLHRLALVDAQRRDRLGPAEPLLVHADRITVVDHHMDQDSDIEATDFVVDSVGSVSTIITERIQAIGKPVLSNAEATLLALGIHADTGSLCFDSTTPRDASALAWLLSQGASQTAIAEHAQSGLSAEQQGVLTQALVNTNTTEVQGVTISTVLLQSEGFINGLAAVTQDALDLSSSDVFLFGLVYQAKSGSRRRKKERQQMKAQRLGEIKKHTSILYAEAWQGGEEALRRRRLTEAFDRADADRSGYLERSEVAASLASAGVLLQADTVQQVMERIDLDGDGRIDFEEFVKFATEAEEAQRQKNAGKGTTMILIGRVRAGINVRNVKLNTIMERFGGGGHAKAASATIRLNDESEAEQILQEFVNEIMNTTSRDQPLVRDFMTSPVLTASGDMTEVQLDDMFKRYNVRAFPIVDNDNCVIGIVSFQMVADAKQRLENKIQRSIRMGAEAPRESAVKGWMLQHVQTVEEDKTMAEVESVLLENDVGCIPVVETGTMKLVGMVTRTDILRQHRYYPNLPYHNKGFADSIAARKPIIELRKKLKQFDLDE